MAEEGRLLPITQIGDPVLLQKAEPVNPADIGSEQVQQVIRDMRVTMYAAPGIGLAAPQVSISKRIIVFYLPAGRDGSSGAGVPFTVLINPVIEKIGDTVAAEYEGCLSVAGKRGRVVRHERIRYSGLDGAGREVSVEASGWHARVVQHECDHLDGILYPQIMQEEDELLDTEVWKKMQEEKTA